MWFRPFASIIYNGLLFCQLSEADQVPSEGRGQGQVQDKVVDHQKETDPPIIHFRGRHFASRKGIVFVTLCFQPSHICSNIFQLVLISIDNNFVGTPLCTFVKSMRTGLNWWVATTRRVN